MDDEVVRLLKERARRNRRSAEAEHRTILHDALRPAGATLSETAAALRNETKGRGGEEAAAIIRRFRDERSESRKP